MDVVHIAQVCHEANRAYCRAIGNFDYYSQLPWDQAEQWQRDSAINGVRFAIENPMAPPSAQHEAWLKEKKESGWKWGPVKSSNLKQHPCCVDYEKLPAEERVKDVLFRSIVNALSGSGE